MQNRHAEKEGRMHKTGFAIGDTLSLSKFGVIRQLTTRLV